MNVKPDRSSARRTAANARPFAAPVSVKAKNFAISQPLNAFFSSNQTFQTLAKKRAAKTTDAELGGERTAENPGSDTDEVNKLNERPIRTIDPNAVPSKDGAYRPDTRKRPDVAPLPTPLLTFEGISKDDTIALGQGFVPPDTVGAVGPNHYVQIVNVAFRIWDKQGKPLTPIKSLGDVFANLPSPCTGSIDGDPIVMYDQLADRWLISEFCVTDAYPNRQLIAISTGSDPTGTYFLYDFAMPNTKFPDYPKFGLWPDAYYMSANQFDAGGLLFAGSAFFAFNRNKMLAGEPDATYIYTDTCPGGLGDQCEISGLLPSGMDGFVPPPPGAPNTFAYFTADEYYDPADAVRLFDFHVDFNEPSRSTVAERSESPMPVAAFSPMVPWIPQRGTGTGWWLDPISDRLMYRLAYRHFGDGREALVFNHSVLVDYLYYGRGAIRYYELDRSSPLSAYSIKEQQTFALDDDASRWMGSVAMNHQGDTAIGYSASGSSFYPSIRYAARLSGDPAGSGFDRGEQEVTTGESFQVSSSRRWGDYSAMTLDPTDDCTFWYTQEYTQQFYQNASRWQTRVAKLNPGPCTVSPRGEIRGRVTSCSTGLPLSGILVDATGGFDRTTKADGTYSMTVSPGSYSIFARKYGYRTTDPMGVNVADGGSVTQDFCVAPQPVLSANAISVMSGNQFIEPNECNWVDIPLTNSGAGTSANISAILSTTTPGVTIGNASSSYSDIAPAGTAHVNVPFQITTDQTVACGSNIDLTLTVNYSGGQYITHLSQLVGEATSPDYVFTASTGATIPTTGTFIPHSDEFTFDKPIISSPFNFSVYGKPIVAGGPICLGRAGLVSFSGYLWLDNSINQTLPEPWMETSPIGVLAPFWADNQMRNDEIQGSGMWTELTGNAPNRTFMIEWRSRNSYPNLYGPVDTDFAVFFHENSDNFEYVYKGTGSDQKANGVTATVGIQSGNYGEHFTQYSYKSPVITPGLKLSASRPKGVCAAGNGTCGPMPTPTPPPPVSVAGRVTGPDGRGIRNVTVTLIDTQGHVRSAVTSSFGFYSFDAVLPGDGYRILVSSRVFRFSPVTGLSITGDITDLNFVGLE